jgi:hypothetical protein
VEIPKWAVERHEFGDAIAVQVLEEADLDASIGVVQGGP